MRRLRLIAAIFITFAPSAALAQEAVEYYGLDAVGSVRVVFDASGSVAARMDYSPFGQELATRTGLPSRTYAGLFQDGESGLDQADVRSYQVRSARFTNIDPVKGSPDRPQSWNRYSYSLNNPLTLVDPSGADPAPAVNCGLGAYWCPGAVSGASVERYFDAQQYGYHGGELAAAEARYDAAVLAQTRPVSSVSILGKNVTIKYYGISDAERLQASKTLLAAIALLNNNADKLTPHERDALAQIAALSVVSTGSALGYYGHAEMALSPSYMQAASDAWIGSTLGHEGQHALNVGQYAGSSLWKDEQSAARTQLGIGIKIGFTRAEIANLRQWAADSNREAMQQHMLNGLRR
jgi:RHS repeat-associated protein